MDYSTKGKQVVAYVYSYTRSLTCRDVIESARNSGMTLLGFDYVRGSIALMLAESHLIVHNVRGVYRIDVYTCGSVDPMQCVRELLRRCGAIRWVIEHECERGVDERVELGSIY